MKLGGHKFSKILTNCLQEEKEDPNEFLGGIFFQKLTVFLRLQLVPWIEPDLLESLTVTTAFLTFITVVLQRPKTEIVVIDGNCMQFNDWRAARMNLLRAVIQRNPEFKFLLFSRANLNPYALDESNLIVIREDFSTSSVNSILWNIVKTHRRSK